MSDEEASLPIIRRFLAWLETLTSGRQNLVIGLLLLAIPSLLGASWWAGGKAISYFIGDRVPVIGVSYDVQLIGLPLTIPPHSTIPIIKVREGRKVDITQHQNTDNKPLLWPADKVTPPEPVSVIRFVNQGDVGVFNAAYSIKVNIGAQKDPRGVTPVPLTLPVFNLPVGMSGGFYIVNRERRPLQSPRRGYFGSSK